MSIRHEIRELIWKTGYDIRKLDPASYSLARIRTLFKTFGITAVLDIGANKGKFANYVRKDVGFRGKLVSIEPLQSAFNALQGHAAHDPLWQTINIALGEKNRKGVIRVSNNSESSSLLSMMPAHLRAAPESKYVGEESVEIRTLDSIFGTLCSVKDSVFLKIDTQGYEHKVLQGAKKSLSYIDTIQLEMSLEPLYRGELVFSDMYEYLRKRHYSLVSIEPVLFGDGPVPVLQVDGIFHRF